MTKDKFVLIDEEFAYLAVRACQEFDKVGMKHAVVGNVAVQAQILNMMSRQTGLPVQALHGTYDLSDYLRPTSDVDIAILPEINESANDITRKILHVRNVLNGIKDDVSGSEQFLFGYHLIRPGTKRNDFQACVDGDCQGIVGVKLLTSSKDLDNFDSDFYQEMIKGAYHIKLPYSSNGYALEFRAVSPKDLLLVKGVQARPKDDMDVGALAEAMSLFGKDGFDLRKMEAVFGDKYKHAFPRFLALTEKYAKGMRK